MWKKLPLSKRDLWFEVLESLGFDEPFEQNIPDDFNSNLWYTSEKYSKLIGEIMKRNNLNK